MTEPDDVSARPRRVHVVDLLHDLTSELRRGMSSPTLGWWREGTALDGAVPISLLRGRLLLLDCEA